MNKRLISDNKHHHHVHGLVKPVNLDTLAAVQRDIDALPAIAEMKERGKLLLNRTRKTQFGGRKNRPKHKPELIEALKDNAIFDAHKAEVEKESKDFPNPEDIVSQ